MKTPYTFHFSAPPLSEDFRSLPPTTMPFKKAQQTLHLNFGSAEITSQMLNFFPFYMDLVEINSSENFSFRYEIHQPQHFLIILLKGSVCLTSENGLFVSRLKENHFGLSRIRTGRVEIEAGNHIALCVAIDDTWLNYISSEFPVLQAFLQQGHDSPLPYCRLTKGLHAVLSEILSRVSNGVASFELFYKTSIFTLLRHYNMAAARKQKRLPYRVIQYIHAHYSDADLSSPAIAYHFEIAERSLRDQFKREFGITIQDYFTHLRVRSAIQLMKENNLGPLDVFLAAGFKEANTLRYHLEKFRE